MSAHEWATIAAGVCLVALWLWPPQTGTQPPPTGPTDPEPEPPPLPPRPPRPFDAEWWPYSRGPDDQGYIY